MESTQATSAGVFMTRREAEAFMQALDKAQKSAVFQINAIERKKWTPAERAMAAVPYRQQLEALALLKERIGGTFSLGGY